MSVTPLAVRKNQNPDPERAALCDAVAAAAEARDAGMRAESAIERAERLLAENQTKLASATKAVADAQTEDARRLASVLASGGTSPTARATRQARSDAAEAADDVEAAKSALASLREDLVEAERDVAAAGRAVDAALAEALKPVALRLLTQARAHHLAFLTTSEALHVVARLLKDGDEVAKAAARVGSFVEEDVRASVVTRKQWESTIAALREDADAPLPDDTPPT